MLAEAECTLPTIHPKIRIAKVRECDYETVDAEIDDLVAGCMTDGDMETVRKMKRIVPEFKSQHSKYELLDNQA